jgi:nitrite reductase (NADH) small subunit
MAKEPNIQAPKIQIKLGPVGKIPFGQGLCFKVEDREVAVFRTRSGQLSAIQNRCPHRQGPLCDGVIDETQVICPYHGHKFNLKTGEGSEEAERVTVYQVREENGELILEI